MTENENERTYPGLSLRDYFAAHALVLVAAKARRGAGDEDKTAPEVYAEGAYQVADAMLAERAK